MQKILCYTTAQRDACALYRTELPVKFCRDFLIKNGFDLNLCNEFDHRTRSDIYWFHRFVSPYFFPYIYDLKDRGEKLIWDWDDLISDIPTSNPASNIIDTSHLSQFNKYCGWSNAVSVSTKKLGNNLGFVEKSWVLPNLIDLDMWMVPQLPDRVNKIRDGEIRIVFAGSNTHQGDLLECLEALSLIQQKYKNVHVFFLGDAPHGIHSNDRVTHLSWQHINIYPRFLRLIAPQICVAPLQNCRFNECKSEIRILESTLAGGAVCASALGPYFDFPGTIQCSDKYDWVEKLSDLIEDEGLRQNCWCEAFAEVQQNWSWQNNASLYSAKLLEILEAVC